MMYIRNSNGPSTDPCGTPVDIGSEYENTGAKAP